MELYGEGDAAEERERAEGLQAPPASVLVPRISGENVVEPGAVEYQLTGFPWEPWTLTSRMALTQAQAAAWTRWLNEAEAGRLAVIGSVLERAGAPASVVRDQPEGLLALGAWMQRWFGLVAEPFLARGSAGDPGWRRGFFQDQPEVRLGSAWAPSAPSDRCYSRFGDALLHSLALDLAFLVTDCARVVRPALRWQAALDGHFQDFFFTPDPEPPPFQLVRRVREFLVQSTARPRGARGRELRQWRGRALYGCYQRAAASVPDPPEYEAFPGANQYREGGRYRLARPRRTAPPPPRELVGAVTAFRRAGWFETAKLAAADLAAAARAAWRAYEREDIPLTTAEMNWRLLVLDGGRTWSEDVDADVRPQDNLHEQTLFAIGQIGGKGFGGFRDVAEHWEADSGDVELSLWWGRRKHRLRLPAPGRYLSPALITGLNDLLPAGRPRLWFFDHGPPIGIVTRATVIERDALEQLTGIRLDPDPPGWWTELAPLPPPQQPGTARRAPATRAIRPRAAGERAVPAPARPGPGSGQAGAPTQSGESAARPVRPAATAQDVFKQMMRDLITPALRELGFRGGRRSFWYQDGDYAGELWTQSSVYSSKDRVKFTVHLGASHVPTRSRYWTRSLLGLIPDNQVQWWTVSAGGPADTAAATFLGAVRGYGWPALLAALDDPGFPPDPAARWARTSPLVPGAPARQGTRADLGPLAWVLHPAGRDSDRLFAGLADDDYLTRFTAMELIAETAIDDPRALPALMNRLEHDPSEAVRRMAALGLRHLAPQESVRHALQAAATEDEDLEVRWEARYALRLADSQDPDAT